MGEIGVFLRASSYLHDKEPVVLRCSVTARALDSEALSLANLKPINLHYQPLRLGINYHHHQAIPTFKTRN